MNDDTRKLLKIFGVAVTDACPGRADLPGRAGGGVAFCRAATGA
jgi:hypothetical protein